MKRFVWVVVLAGLLVVALASTALAAPPAPYGAGPGNGIRRPGTGLSQPGTDFGAGAGGGARRGAPEWAGQPAEVKALLGMTEEQIEAERLAGKSLAKIAEGKGVTPQKLVETILAAKKATLDTLVAGGRLTQAQADYKYSRMQTQVSVMVDRTTTGPAWRQGGAKWGASVRGRWNQ